MRRVGIVAVGTDVRARDDRSPPEMVFPLVRDVIGRSGFRRGEIDLTCAGSSDMLEGRPFSFGFALDVTGAVPPIEESHIEGDGAWAAYEAWVRIQAGTSNVALVVAWGKSSEGSVSRVLNTMLDPFYESPLGLDHLALSALQARAAGSALGTPAPPVDGVCAMVIGAEDALRQPPMAWIAGAAHSTDGAHSGARDLSDVASARRAMASATAMAGWSEPDRVVLHARFDHEVSLLERALGVSGGVRLPNDPLMATGLRCLSDAAVSLHAHRGRALAHATSGMCLQANMTWLLESA